MSKHGETCVLQVLRSQNPVKTNSFCFPETLQNHAFYAQFSAFREQKNRKYCIYIFELETGCVW